MTQNELNRQVAEATGESVALIEAMGFSLLVAPSPERRRRQVGFHPGAVYRNKGRRQPHPLRRRSPVVSNPSMKKGA